MYVSPGRQQFHPSAAKCWVYYTYSGGTPTIQVSYNVTSLTDTAVGQATINFTTNFSSANYACVVGQKNHGAGLGGNPTQSTSQCSIRTRNTSFADTDTEGFAVLYGDQ